MLKLNEVELTIVDIKQTKPAGADPDFGYITALACEGPLLPISELFMKASCDDIAEIDGQVFYTSSVDPRPNGFYGYVLISKERLPLIGGGATHE